MADHTDGGLDSGIIHERSGSGVTDQDCVIISEMNEPVILRSEQPATDDPAGMAQTAAACQADPAGQGGTAAGVGPSGPRRQRFPLVPLWVTACLVMQMALGSLVLHRGTDPRSVVLLSLWLGTMWGGWAGWIWLCSACRNWSIGGMFALAAATVWHIHWMSQTTETSAARCAVMLGGYALAQAITFRLLGVARWHASPLRIAPAAVVRVQFGIGELIGLTTVVAVLITAAGGYQPPLGEVYWWGLLVAEALLVAIATLSVMAEQRRGSRSGWLRIGVVVAIASAAGILNWLETIAGPSAAAASRWPPYAMLLLTFWVWIATLGNCGQQPSQDMAPNMAPGHRMA